MILKRIASGIVTTSLLCSLALPSLATDSQTALTFSDVASDHWANWSITEMVGKGLLSGTTTTVDGVGTYAPSATMTRAEFVTVVLKAVYPDEFAALDAAASGSSWWSNNYALALEKGLLTSTDLDSGALGTAMSRQEMAMVLVRALEAQGATSFTLVDSSCIADYDSIDSYYQSYVLSAYSLGLIAGVDTAGTYAPNDTTTRAAAAVVLHRLVEPGVRVTVTTSTTEDAVVDDITPITIKEGAVTTRRLARAGDTVVTSSGYSIVLTETVVDGRTVVGYGQGVAPDWGRKDENGVTVTDSPSVKYSGTGTDAAGDAVNGQCYYINPYTGEGHWSNEWDAIQTEEKEYLDKLSYNAADLALLDNSFSPSKNFKMTTVNLGTDLIPYYVITWIWVANT